MIRAKGKKDLESLKTELEGIYKDIKIKNNQYYFLSFFN